MSTGVPAAEQGPMTNRLWEGKRRIKIVLARKEQVVHIPVNRKFTDSGRPGGTNTSTE